MSREQCICCGETYPHDLLDTGECFACYGSHWTPSSRLMSKFQLNWWECLVADVRSRYRHWHYAKQKRDRARLERDMSG